MTEQQPGQEQKKRAGSIRQYATLGRAKAPEPPDVQTSRSQRTEVSGRSDAQKSERLEARTLERSGGETSERQNVQELERSEGETSKRQDIQESEHSGVRAPKRERHTIYLPRGLSKWVKHRAIDQECEISEIVTEALERYRAEG